jgi:uncharacterized integral membrane protein
MRARDRLHAHRWILLAVLALALVAGHAVILRYTFSRLSLPVGAVAAVVAAVLIKYLALRRGLRPSRTRRERRGGDVQ